MQWPEPSFRPVTWEDGHIRMLDQRLLPTREIYLELTNVEDTAQSIENLAVRGAPAIGITAAYGVVVGIQNADGAVKEIVEAVLPRVVERLRHTRPTAVNLFWALERMEAKALELADLPVDQFKAGLLAEAREIELEDLEMCKAMGEHGATLIPAQATILTHCNAGGLATAAYGTALGVIRAAHYGGKTIRVLADETRPVNQGARLTSWELLKDGIDVTLICDNSAGLCMQKKEVDLVITGADRIAANGDTANKIGTYSVATLARAHGIPFYIAAPTSTIDLALNSGGEIPIEERPGNEIKYWGGQLGAPEDVKVLNRAFDVTPAGLIAAIITEQGVIKPPFKNGLKAAVEKARQQRSAKS